MICDNTNYSIDWFRHFIVQYKSGEPNLINIFTNFDVKWIKVFLIVPDYTQTYIKSKKFASVLVLSKPKLQWDAWW